MASSDYGAAVETAIEGTDINADTPQEIFQQLRSLPRQSGNMKTVLDAVAAAKGKCWVSRKRVRSDALRLILEGGSFT